jgi:peptidoglycan/xylan/chitin deacetylase (PgdA/CDA1 family)
VERMHSLEERLGVKSSIFFLTRKRQFGFWEIGSKMLEAGACRISIPDVRNAIKYFSEKGWDVGIHQSIEAYEDAELLRDEKHDIEQITGKDVLGVRQHYLKMRFPDFWFAHERAGLKYDSTVGFRDGIGFRAGTSFPYQAFDPVHGANIAIVEIPLIIMEREIFLKDDPWMECKALIDTVEMYGGVLTILWHQRFFNEQEFPGYADLYRKIIEYCREQGAWLAPLNEINGWWAGR